MIQLNKKIKITPSIAFDFISKKILYYHFNRANIKLGKKVVFKKKPLFKFTKKSSLIIGNNVLINSQNKGYYLNLFTPCKLITSQPDAVIQIGDNTRFHGSCIHASKSIIVGKNCLIAANCQIMDNNGHDISFPNTSNRINTKGRSKEVIIEDNVWLATGVIVLPGVTIGRGSIITANSIVHKNIPPMVIAGGNPIKIIKEYQK